MATFVRNISTEICVRFIDSDWTGGKTAGVIIGCIVLVTIVGAVAYYYRKKNLNITQHSFENVAHKSRTTNAGLALDSSQASMKIEQHGQEISVAYTSAAN